MSFVKMGVRYRKQQAVKGKWHFQNGTEPKVHLLVYSKENRVYYRLCRSKETFFESHGIDVPDNTPVTCSKCLKLQP